MNRAALLGHDDATDAGAPRQENAAMVAFAIFLGHRRAGCRQGVVLRWARLDRGAADGTLQISIRHFFIVAD